MAFLTIFDETGSIECVIFPKIFTKLKTFIGINNVIILKGKVSNREDKLSVLVDNAVQLK